MHHLHDRLNKEIKVQESPDDKCRDADQSVSMRSTNFVGDRLQRYLILIQKLATKKLFLYHQHEHFIIKSCCLTPPLGGGWVGPLLRSQTLHRVRQRRPYRFKPNSKQCNSQRHQCCNSKDCPAYVDPIRKILQPFVHTIPR